MVMRTHIETEKTGGRWRRSVGGLLSAAVLLPVPVLALLWLGLWAPPALSADDPPATEFLAFEAPAANRAQAASPEKKSGVAVVEKAGAGEETVTTVESWENTDFLLQFPWTSLTSPPRHTPFDVLLPTSFIYGDTNHGVQFFKEYQRTKNKKRVRVLFFAYIFDRPGSVSPFN
jgi:hypothetical protein